MKKIIFFIMATAVLVACNNNSYSKQLQKEKKLIEAYIAHNQLNILKTMPDSGVVWGEKDYYQVPGSGSDYFFFHLDKPGLVDKDSVVAGETIVLRYRRYTLTDDPIVDDYWNTLDSPAPIEFKYLADYKNACTAWHAAVRLMKYPEAQCKIICPSKLGFSEEQNTVTPYGYDIKIKIKR